MSEVTTIGLDLAKHVFQVHGVDAAGGSAFCANSCGAARWWRFSRLPRCLVGLEACATAHYWARELQAVGHGGPAEHAVCGDQDSRAASRPAAAPWPGKAGSAAHRPSQLS